MSNLTQTATALNMTGVQLLLSEQNYDGAIAAFTESIRNLKQELILTSQNRTNEKTDCEREAQQRSSANIDFCELGESDDDIPFNRAITITCREGAHVVREPDTQLFSAAVIYNIALVHHHQVVYGSYRTNQCPHSVQRKAEKLYETVITLLASNLLECPSLIRAAVLIQLACCNNLAQLRFRSGLDESARGCLEMASGLLSLAKDDMIDEAVFEDSLVQGLILRAFLLRTIPQMAAAA